MKFEFLGTAAYEGMPALFCKCENCRKARLLGGRALRTRSQAVIDDRIMIDFPPDTYAHSHASGLDFLNIRYCLITHSHSDHLYPEDIQILEEGYGHTPKDYHLTICGTKVIGEAISDQLEAVRKKKESLDFYEVKPFDEILLDDYKITVLPAVHAPKSGAVIYQIEREGKTVLYGMDTGFFEESVWNYFADKKPVFSLVVLDCTNACKPLNYVGHMDLAENVRIRNKMLEEGYADEKTIFICNHFSHNGHKCVYDEFVPIAEKEGFRVSYDGMKMYI